MSTEVGFELPKRADQKFLAPYLQVGPDIVVTIAANKSDLEKERSVPDAVVAAYAKDSGASYFNTSAKTGSGLELAFLDIAKRVMEKQHEKAARNSGTGNQGF